MQVFLNNDVASACELRVFFFSNERRMKSRLTTRIFCPVNESQKVTIVEVAEAVGLVNRRNRSSNPLHDLGDQLETHIHSLGADMKQRISGSRHRVAFSRSYFAKRMELCRPGLAEEPVPSIRPKPRDTREPSLDATEIDRSKNSREIGAERATVVQLSRSGLIQTTRN